MKLFLPALRLRLALASTFLLISPFFSTTAQPFVETQVLTANGVSDFGHSVSVYGDRALVSAGGSAVIFERDPISGEWIEVQELVPSAYPGTGGLGNRIAISSDFAFIGADMDEEAGFDAGAVYVFGRDAQTGAWSQHQKLIGSDTSDWDRFGNAVSIAGDVALIGAFDDGSAYVFERDGGTGEWVELQKLTPSTPQAWWFGISVSISDGVALIGASIDSDAGFWAGSAFVFERDPQTGQWVEVQKLIASDAGAQDYFGETVSVSGGFALVGARSNDGAGLNAGSAYLFERDVQTGAWGEVQKLTASDATAEDGFGNAVSVSSYAAVIGSSTNSAGGGSAYVFEREGQTGTWVERQKLTASDAEAGDLFGKSVSIVDGVVLVGALDAGAAYVYERSAVAVTASGDASVAQGGTLTVSATAQNLTGTPLSGRLVLAAVGPGGQVATRQLAAGVLPPGATVSRTFRVRVGNVPVGTWMVTIRVEDEGGQTLGSDAFTVEVTPASAVAGAPFGVVEEVASVNADAAPLAVALVGPNPFRGRTALALTLAAPSAVRLTLHDVLGREVAVPASGRYAAGRHVVPIEAGELPGGVYVWRLSAAGAVTTGRVTVAR